MSLDSDFDFGINYNLKLQPNMQANGLDKVITQVESLHLNAKGNDFKGPGPKMKKSVDSFNFDFSDVPESPLSSTTSIHSAMSEMKPTSSYWHVPDKHSYLTSIAIQENTKLCAIGSGGTKDNLFVYEVYPDEVTHHQTITLPEIHSLKWASPETQLGQMGNVLVSGHNSGVAHLTILPDSSAKDGSAEILKRYNHVKHLPSPSQGGIRSRSLRIRNLELTSASWKCCAPSSLFTLCGDHLFLWEPNRSDVPLVMQKTHSTNTMALSDSRDGVYALGRRRGVCIRDIRVRDRVNSGLKPPVSNDESVTMVKWNPYSGGNQLAAVHDRTTIKLWDIRSKEPLASFNRHADTITSLGWSSESELVSASRDGTVRVWDVEDMPSINNGVPRSPPSINESFESSTWNDYLSRKNMDSELEGFAEDLLKGAPPIDQSRQFLGMALSQMGPVMGAVTVDSGGFLGVHEISESYNDLHTTSPYDLPPNGRSGLLSEAF